MAAAKKSAKRKAPADTTPGLEEIRIKYDPVMIALSKAEAARQLLVSDDCAFSDEVTDWINQFAADALVAALEEARVAYVKVAADRAATTAPPTEATR